MFVERRVVRFERAVVRADSSVEISGEGEAGVWWRQEERVEASG